MSSSSAPSNGSAPDDLAGRVLAGRYRLNREIASGGMATVWEGTDQLLARRVAIKILHPHLASDATFVRRFRGEAIAAARLAHPSIVSVYDTVADQGLNAIVMELVSGTTLRADLDEHGPLQLHAMLAIGTQVADALGAAHASGLVHRDVKPANILLSADGRVLVADFGIAKAAQGSDLTEAGSMVGTAKYLAPEQVQGDAVDGRTDLYALGVVLYEALTGQPPFVAETDAGTALARLHRDPVPPRRLRPEIPVGVEQVVVRAMARRPEDRFADAAEMRRALLAAGADPSRASAVAQAAVAASTGEHPTQPPTGRRAPRPSGTTPPPPPPPASRPAPVASPSPQPGWADADAAPRRRRAWPWVAGCVVVALLAAAAVAVAIRSGDEPGPVLALRRVSDFDPRGTKGENHALLQYLVDDDPTSTWRTETYATGPDVYKQGEKSGVGFYVTLPDARKIETLELDTVTGGWSASIYVTDQIDASGRPPADLDGWGSPAKRVSNAPSGRFDVHLGGVSGKAVLVWFTRLSSADGGYAVRVGNITLRGP